MVIMRRHEMVDYEPASDSGHFRMYPKGQLMFELLRDWSYEIAVNRFGVMPIESPLLYDKRDREILEQAGSFRENHYSVNGHESDHEFILRFAGDFGLFKIMQQARFSHKQLPIRMYEFSKSFRYERSGALSGLKRLRAFIFRTYTVSAVTKHKAGMNMCSCTDTILNLQMARLSTTRSCSA